MKSNREVDCLRAEHMVSILNILEADEYFLLTKIRCAHLNLSTESEEDMKSVMGGHCSTIEKTVDEIAEKVRDLGQTVTGSLKDFLRLAHLTEQKENSGNLTTTIQNLMENHGTIVYFIKDVLKISDKTTDFGIADFLVDVMKRHENMIRELKTCFPKNHPFQARALKIPQQEYELTAT